MFAAAAAADRPSGDDTHWRGRDREQGREGHLVAAQFTAEGSERSLPGGGQPLIQTLRKKLFTVCVCIVRLCKL